MARQPCDRSDVVSTGSCFMVPTGTVSITFFFLHGTGVAIRMEAVSRTVTVLLERFWKQSKVQWILSFPILFKLSAQDFVDNGLEPPEALEISRRLQDGGVAAIQVSACCSTSRKDRHCPKTEILEPEDEGYLLDFSQDIKDSVKVPVIAVGGIRSLLTAERVLKEGKADYISLARPLIREPNLINRWKSGNTAKAKCISCNCCFETGRQGLGISCKIERMLKENKEES